MNSKTFQEMERLNAELHQKFVDHASLETLLNYVMSEVSWPIEDFANAVNLIKSNMKLVVGDINLLVLGAFLKATWMQYEENDLLETLNPMCISLPKQQQAIIHYLNAYQIFQTNNDYRKDKKYMTELKKSIECDNSLVYNYYFLAKSDLLDRKDVGIYLSKALTNVKKVYSDDPTIIVNAQTITVPHSCFDSYLDIGEYIAEHVAGIHLSEPNYNSIKSELDSVTHC